MPTTEQRAELQTRIINSLDDELPVGTNVAALAFTLVQLAQVTGMSKGKFIDALSRTWDVLLFHNETKQ